MRFGCLVSRPRSLSWTAGPFMLVNDKMRMSHPVALNLSLSGFVKVFTVQSPSSTHGSH
jgi:hypothetical protein